MRRHLFLFAAAALICTGAAASDEEGPLTGLVDPFIGTGGHGHTYPGPSLPFGMVQLGPDTRLSGWDGCSAYHYSDDQIYGFSHTHLSGTGCSDYGDILFMPLTGRVRPSAMYGEERIRSSFRHETERAEPGYYSVHLDDFAVKAELTVTERCGFHRYTFEKGGVGKILIDLAHRDEVIEAALRIAGPREVEGFRRSRGWAADQHVYFSAIFSVPFDSSLVTVNGEMIPEAVEVAGGKIRGLFTFNSLPGLRLTVKVGISAVSMEGARENLEKELPGTDFDGAAAAARSRWNEALGRIRVSGGAPGRREVFYTALYHSMLAPNLYSDVDGRYRGRDLEVHRADGFDYYTVFSLWDTYRAAHPLFTIIEQDRTVDFIKTFIRQYEDGGRLPVWELGANETDCMIGYHSVSVIADAYAKGIRDFDVRRAFEAMKRSAGDEGPGLKDYREKGYIESGSEGESVSKTLEYAYDDWCIAVVAKGLGEDDDYERFIRRAQQYKNLFDPSTGFMRGRVNGGWIEPFDPSEVNFNYTEANSYQYSFYAPQDISGLIELSGGGKRFCEKLDALFSASSALSGLKLGDVTGMIGQYAHGNEPSQHMAYLYDFAGRPWKTQEKVREIVDRFYSAGPEGLCGNEDCGQMSAWFVFSALGFYPVTPGQGIYIIGTPHFEEAVIDVGRGRSFTVRARNLSPRNFYIQGASLDGAEYTKSYISHRDIVRGGTLVFDMGPRPASGWGCRPGDLPVSAIEDNQIIATPFLSPSARAFTGAVDVSLGCVTRGATIYYTVDGGEPSLGSGVYAGPVRLAGTSTLKAFAYMKGAARSLTVTGEYMKIEEGKSVWLTSPYSSMYTGGGDLALIDGIRGGIEFRSGGWQGYEGVDLDAVVDLGRTMRISRISTGFLQNQRSWIFLPVSVEYAVSLHGRGFTVVAVVGHEVELDCREPVILEMEARLEGIEARYVRVRARNIGTVPPWHNGAGNRAWLFADEIVVE